MRRKEGKGREGERSRGWEWEIRGLSLQLRNVKTNNNNNCRIYEKTRKETSRSRSKHGGVCEGDSDAGETGEGETDFVYGAFAEGWEWEWRCERGCEWKWKWEWEWEWTSYDAAETAGCVSGVRGRRRGEGERRRGRGKDSRVMGELQMGMILSLVKNEMDFQSVRNGVLRKRTNKRRRIEKSRYLINSERARGRVDIMVSEPREFEELAFTLRWEFFPIGGKRNELAGRIYLPLFFCFSFFSFKISQARSKEYGV